MKKFFIISILIISFLTPTLSLNILSTDKGIFNKVEIFKNSSSIKAKAKVTFFHKFNTTLNNYNYDFRFLKSEKRIIKADFSFNLKDLDTGINARNRKMLNWLDAEKHPRAEFKMTGAEKKRGKYFVKGSFELNGVSREIEIIFKISFRKDLITIDGETELYYTEFALPKIKMLLLSVNPRLKITFHLEGKIE